MAGENKLMQLAQYAGGGSPYDEEEYQEQPLSYVNQWLNERLSDRPGPGRFKRNSVRRDQYFFGTNQEQLPDYEYNVYGRRDLMNPEIQGLTSYRNANPDASQQRRGGYGTDMDMLMMYGPEDQVEYDRQQRPIPLNDPRHSRFRGVAPGVNDIPAFNPSAPGGSGGYSPPGYPQRRR